MFSRPPPQRKKRCGGAHSSEKLRIELESRLAWVNSETPFPKTRAEWTGGEVQAVEHLLCERVCFANSNPSPTQK
jgi:hypothetical protein